MTSLAPSEPTVSARHHEFAFLDEASFLRAPREGDPRTRPFGLAGLCWDGSTTNRPGARFGPRAIRQASHMLCDGTHPYFGCSPTAQLFDFGDLPLPNTGLAPMRAELARLLPGLLASHHMVWLGGDHSVTLPVLRALREQLGRAPAVIHFDAHCDTWRDHFGEPSGHGTWVYEALEEGLAQPECFVQLGIRSAADAAARDHVRQRGGLIYPARELRGLESPRQLADVLGAIRQRLAVHGHPPVYLSLDIDCLDPAFAPGTGTPEPGGLSTAQVLSFLEELADLPFVGMDCVEVAPAYDHAELTASAAATFVWSYLSGRVAQAARAEHTPLIHAA